MKRHLIASEPVALQTELDALNRLHAGSRRGLCPTLAANFDRAFKGKL